MARTRLIVSDAPLDDKVASCSVHARLTWAYLPCHADREGRLEDKPFRLKTLILPCDAVDMNAVLDELAAAGLIYRYEADGRRCIQIRSFKKHQRPHPNEAASILPAAPRHGEAKSEPQSSHTVGQIRDISNQGDPPSHQRIAEADQRTPQEGNVALDPVSGSGSGGVSARVRDPMAPAPTPALAPVQAPEAGEVRQKTTAHELAWWFGIERQDALPDCQPFRFPGDKGQTASFAEQLSPAEVADVRRTMRLFFSHVKQRQRDWDDPKLQDNATFAFAAWRARFTQLREELLGKKPTPPSRAPPPRGDYPPRRQIRELDENSR